MNKKIKNYKKGGFIKDLQNYQNTLPIIKQNTLPIVKQNTQPIIKQNTHVVKQNTQVVKQNTLPIVKQNTQVVKQNTQPIIKQNTQPIIKQNTQVVKQNTQPIIKQNTQVVKPNTQVVKSNSGFVKSNTQVVKPNTQVVKSNSGFVKSNSGFVKPNTPVVKSNSGFVKSNTQVVKSNTQVVKQNTQVVKSNSGFIKGDGIGVKGDMDGFGKEKGNMNPRFVYLYKNKFELEALSNKYDMNGLSPLSGYEPKYNPNYWNNNKNIKNNNNCYSYSVNNKNHKFGKPQPGYFARFNHIQNNQYKCAYFFKRILNDIPSVYLTSFKQKCKKGFTKAFFAIDSNKNEHDYHFYRQDTNKLWSHKPGTTNVINYDADYKIIKNPLKANRNYTTYYYDKPCFFFCVNNKFGKTKAQI